MTTLDDYMAMSYSIETTRQSDGDWLMPLRSNGVGRRLRQREPSRA